MHSIQIDSEFQALIPPLSAEERAQLEANIVADGCRDPLVVWPLPTMQKDVSEAQDGSDVQTYVYADAQVHCEWREEGGKSSFRQWGDSDDPTFEEEWPCVLIDGHNRHEICTRLGLPFEVVHKEFESRVHVRIWMRQLQRGRRNLSDGWMIELALGDKADLLTLGGAKMSDAKIGNQNATKNNVITNDKVDLPKHNTQKEVAKAAGVSTGQIAKAEIVKRKAPELWEKAKAQELTIGAAYTQIVRAEKEEKREERREENRAKIAEVATPAAIIEAGAKFSTIMIDPPWDWGDEGDKDQLGRAKPDYSTMSIEELMALPIPDLSDVDSHMYMWITNRSLPKGFALMEKWGFRYITAITWVKPSFGMGNYFRGQTEHVLFGVKGSQMLKRKDVGTVFSAARGDGGHSSKPLEFYGLVESCSPGPYLEMFSRSQREGWTTWGENSNGN